MVKSAPIDTYISAYPKEVQELMQQIRSIVRDAAPGAEETISYGIPTFKLNGNLVHFAAFKNHIGLYAMPTSNEKFAKELSKYKQGKGSVQFPLSETLPLQLIEKIVKFRVKENLAKAAARKK